MRRFFNTVLIVSLLTFLAKMAIVCKELVVSSRYGRQDEVDAFLIAFLIPSFIISILGNAMNAAFIPVYVEVREKEGKAAAQRLFTDMNLLTLGASLLIAVLIYLSAPFFLPLIASGFSGPKLELTRHLLLLVTPTLLFSGVFSVWGALANAQEKYALVVLTPILTPLLIILLLFLTPSRGIYSLADGSLLGSFLELLVVGLFLRARGVLHGLGDGLRSNLRSVAVKKVLSQFLPASAGALLMISTLLVDQAMAATLPAGSVAALSYGNKVIGFLLTIISTTLATVLLPFFSKQLSGGAGSEFSRRLRKSVLLVFCSAFVFPLLLTAFSETIVRWIFYRGAFTEMDVKLVAGVQSWLSWQIPFYICGVILVKFIASIQRNWITALVCCCNLAANIVLNLLLMRRMGVNGIALSTSLVHVLSLLLLVGFVYFSGKRSRTF